MVHSVGSTCVWSHSSPSKPTPLLNMAIPQVAQRRTSPANPPSHRWRGQKDGTILDYHQRFHLSLTKIPSPLRRPTISGRGAGNSPKLRTHSSPAPPTEGGSGRSEEHCAARKDTVYVAMSTGGVSRDAEYTGPQLERPLVSSPIRMPLAEAESLTRTRSAVAVYPESTTAHSIPIPESITRQRAGSTIVR